MGYRSEVCIAVQMDDTNEQSVKNWHLFIAELKSDPKCDMAMKDLTNGNNGEGVDNEEGIDMKNCSLYVHFSDVKWYDTDKWVQSYNRIIGKASHYCEDDKFKMSACFLRVGEETTDIVEEFYGAYGYDLACLSKPYIEPMEVSFDPDNRLIE